MRIRVPFAVTFLILLLLAGSLSFANVRLPINGKLVHFLAFFVLTTCFYWIFETTRRRVVNMTIVVCLLIGGIGTEFVRSVIVNPLRPFDPLNILANLCGAIPALLLTQWYHKRMLERKRLSKARYQPLAGGTAEDDDDDIEVDQHGDRRGGDREEGIDLETGRRMRRREESEEEGVNDDDDDDDEDEGGDEELAGETRKAIVPPRIGVGAVSGASGKISKQKRGDHWGDMDDEEGDIGGGGYSR